MPKKRPAKPAAAIMRNSRAKNPTTRNGNVVPLREKAGPMTLQETLRHVGITRWRGQRTGRLTYGAGERSIAWLTARYKRVVYPKDVTPAMVKAMVRTMEAGGYAPSTVHRHLNALSALGISCRGLRPRLNPCSLSPMTT